jgi:antitoxin (DNA-binding transcriptional repressor) of toxin-antitoxin stability system
MSVPISKFKAQCLAMLEEVRKTGKPLRVTRFGKPMVDILPATVSAPPSWLGLLEGQGEIVGDIVEPIVAADEWEVLAEPRRTARPKHRRGTR